MRINEPKNNAENKRRNIFAIIVILVLLATVIYYFAFLASTENNKESSAVTSDKTQNVQRTELKKFSGQQFVDFYYTLALPNTQIIDKDSKITGNENADEHIKRLAKNRGYRLQNAPIADVLVKVGENASLQPKVLNDWNKLVELARKDGIALSISDGFRPEDEQRKLFLKRLNLTDRQIKQISNGLFDIHINTLLETTAPPGYSKHHSGYVVDLVCDNDPNVIFEKSSCFNWLSKNNYKNAKTNGFIPSYPKGAKKQGPKPEAWEYAWVGRDSLLE